MGPLGVPELIIIVFVIGMGGVLLIWPAARICRRIGLSPWLGLVAAVPLANVILLWVVAFAPWPAPRSGQAGG